MTNTATVEGGGVKAPISTSEPTTVPNTVNGVQSASLGIQDFDFVAYGMDGSPDTQAADHPNAVTTTFDLTSAVNGEYRQAHEYEPIEEPREARVDLPLGMVGDPLAAAQCKEVDLTRETGETACPLASRVGSVDLKLSGKILSSLRPGPTGDGISAIYNMVPEDGYPAVFGFNFAQSRSADVCQCCSHPDRVRFAGPSTWDHPWLWGRRRVVDVLRQPGRTGWSCG